ncbi:hemicentin-2-like isoform X1 [Pomacea canaliculata]|uniref:hemicentin-2-like isoform X1 n=1 Tax=Pomacea canaliculata TaxID=400727 RepID=UPI000D737E8D|nr:hemicentin-2-like isoform X1 [Pomacea canaliculata]XP_025086135.1 hemicentin-2-like isoform X1 [Pomacea canaliculata]XP_025086137.1 hemicentin-2-like isoform X1 [Pomacea canaliculata]
MEKLCGLYPCCILLATFLIVWTAAAQQIEWVQEPDTTYYIVKRQPANITCEAYGASKITFTCVGSQIPPVSQKTYESFDEARQQTRVRSSIQVTRSDIANQEDSFWCECNAWVDDRSILSTSRRGTVAVAYLKKDFVKEPVNQIAKLGEMVVFSCIPPDGQPFPEVLWRKDQKRVEPGADKNFLVETDGSLTIIRVRQQDVGTYQCVARNDAGRRESRDVQLTVQGEAESSDEVQTTVSPTDTAKPRPQRDSGSPQFLEEPPVEVYVTPNEPVSIVCDVKGADILTFRCNNQRVTKPLDENNDRTLKAIRSVLNWTFAEVENFINTYSEDSFEQKDMLRCMCVAWYTEVANNKVGWKSLQSREGRILLAYLKDDFKAQPRNAVVEVGSDATFACSPPEGKPNPWVYWVFEQQRLDPRTDARYSVSTNGSLTIHRVSSADAGRYYCMAENAMGTRRSDIARLTVSDEPVVTTAEPMVRTTEAYEPTFPPIIPSSPVFTRDLPSFTYLSSDGEATLVCSVISADTLTFRCNGQRLTEDTQAVSRKTDPTSGKQLLTATTTVTNLDIEDSQEQNYKCQCFAWYLQDGQWKYITGTEVTVIPPSLDVDFAYEPQGGMFSLGDTAEFPCQPPSGNPTPEISWLKNGQVVVPGADSHIVILEEGTLMIESVKQEDAGEYVCVATNAAGTVQSRPAVLEVYGTPERRTTAARRTTTTMTPTMTSITHTAPPSTSSFTIPVSSTTPVQSPSTATSTPYYVYTPTDVPSPEPGSTSFPALTLPFFANQPLQRNYIQGDEPASLTCVAVGASMLVFFCNGQRIVQDGAQFKTTDPVSGLALVENTIKIKKDSLSDAQSDAPYKCQCRAYFRETDTSEWKYEATDDFFVEVAYLNKKFVKEPVSEIVQEGRTVELQCSPPQGVPTPSVFWLKDSYRIVENNKYRFTPESSLLIESFGPDDEGSYICQAENIVATRYSQPASLSLSSNIQTNTTTSWPSSTTSWPSSTTSWPPYTTAPSTTPEASSEPEPESTDSSSEPEPAPEPPKWLTQPEALYYIVKSKPVTITCKAMSASRITFSCNTEYISESLVQYQTIEDEEGPILVASVDISREEVENYNAANGGDNFWCQCNVPYQVPGMVDPQELTSSKATVQVAYLKKAFGREPFNVTVPEGKFLSLPCDPPEGNPEPEVYWMFNNERIEEHILAPDKALVINGVKTENEGVYVCVAENIANKRLSRPAIITVTSFSGVDDNTCMTMLKQCGEVMPKPKEDPSTCQKLTQYKECLKNFKDSCAVVLRQESFEAASRSSEMVEKDCSSSREVCQELMTCQSEYSQQSVPNTSADSMPMVALCLGIKTFLRCADEAAEDCNIPQDSSETSLTTIAVWFEQYCEKVVDDEWATRCSQLSSCDLPIQQTTVLANLVQTSLWCKYVDQTMTCTRDALAQCDLPGTRSDLDHLSDLAAKTCPASPEPEGKEDSKVGDATREGDGDDDEEDMDNDGDDEDNEEGKPEGTDETVIDDKTDTGESVGGENGSRCPYASLMLTSLLPVAFLWLTCR